MRIGPFPLTSGLHTRAVDAPDGALLRCCNIEWRDGAARTRRGQSLVGWVDSDTGDMAAVGPSFLVDEATSRPDLTLGDCTIIALGTSEEPVAGELLALTGLLNSNVNVFDYAVEYYSTSGAWVELVTVDTHRLAYPVDTATDAPFAAGTANPRLHFCAPDDWANASPGAAYGAAAWWVRIRAKTATWSAATSVLLNISKFRSRPPRIIIEHTRLGVLGFVGVPGSPPLLPARFMNTTEIDADKQLSSGVAVLDRFDGRITAVYARSTNQFLVSDGNSNYLVSDTGAGNAFSDMVRFNPRTADSVPAADEAYHDIPLRAVLPAFQCATMFAGRIIVARLTGEDGAKLMWSAPDEAWFAWPEDNEAILGGAAAGDIVAMAVYDDTLFIFTTSAVWSATIQIAEGLSEGVLFAKELEKTGCQSPDGVCVCDSGIVFMADDGPRIINTRSSSKPIAPQVSDIFDLDSTSRFACLDKTTVAVAWNPARRTVEITYRSPGSAFNDCLMSCDMARRSVWLSGPAYTTAVETPRTSMSASGSGRQRDRGVCAASMAWNPVTQRMSFVSADGIVGDLHGETDFGRAIQWSMETAPMNIGSPEHVTVGSVEVTVRREHSGPVRVSIIPDGVGARTESRDVLIQSDRLPAASLDGAPATGFQVAGLEESLAPHRARFRKRARNFRVGVSSSGSDPVPIALVSIAAEVEPDKGAR